MTEWIGVIIGAMTLIGVFINAFFTRQVKVHINSRMTELLELTAKSSKAEGKAEGETPDNSRPMDRPF